MNNKQINDVFKEMKSQHSGSENKILIMNVVKHTLEKVMKKDNIQVGYLELSENIFSDNYCESGKTSPELDEKGYYTGYCQCNCKKCLEGKEHCQGLICRGD